ncbi:MAG: TetR/AcrR family transcriptional regulator [Deltaproteobacteria bacterium]|nr:TetR/AcrR family transcriptional regulator [Deltaproteobacteria bacterium]
MTEASFRTQRSKKNATAVPPRGDKRERILRGAIQTFARKGFYTARVSDIAKAAGVADGTIYLYFKNKDDILVSLFEERFDRLISTLRRELPALPDAVSRIRHLISIQLGAMESHRDLAEVITVNLRQSTRFLRQYAAPRFEEYLDVMASVIADGQREGSLRQDLSPMIVARAIFGSIDGLTLTWALGSAGPGELTRAAVQLTDVIVRGLSA